MVKSSGGCIGNGNSTHAQEGVLQESIIYVTGVWSGLVVSCMWLYKSLFRDRQPIQRYIHPPSDSNTRETRELKLRLFLFKDLVGIQSSSAFISFGWFLGFVLLLFDCVKLRFLLKERVIMLRMRCQRIKVFFWERLNDQGKSFVSVISYSSSSFFTVSMNAKEELIRNKLKSVSNI